MKQTSRRPVHKSRSGILIVPIVVLMLFGVVTLIIINERRAAQAHSNTDKNWSLIVRPITARDHTIGNINAPIQLVVFADLQCKYCGGFFNVTVSNLQAIYGDKIVFAYRHLPIPSAMPQSPEEAQASECVYQLGGDAAFWRFAHEIYAIANFYKGIDLSRLPDLAVQAGVDGVSYDVCMKAGDGQARVDQDKLEGSIAGLNLTPSIVLKSAHRAVIVKGNVYSQLTAAIAYLLQTNVQIEQQNKTKN